MRQMLGSNLSGYPCRFYVFLLMCSLGCDSGSDGENISDSPDISAPVNEFIFEEEPLEGMFSWRLEMGQEEVVQSANLKMTCIREKEGQLYVSGTHFDGGNATIGLRISIPDSLPMELPVTGLFEGQDASSGEALASLNGNLIDESGGAFSSVEGVLFLEELDVCRGNFEISFITVDENIVRIREAVFEIPLEENIL